MGYSCWQPSRQSWPRWVAGPVLLLGFPDTSAHCTGTGPLVGLAVSELLFTVSAQVASDPLKKCLGEAVGQFRGLSGATIGLNYVFSCGPATHVGPRLVSHTCGLVFLAQPPGPGLSHFSVGK